MTGRQPVIDIRDLRVVAGDRTLLEHASLGVAANEVVLLVGLSGSGKSVTLRLLLGLLDERASGLHVEGDVRVFGKAPGESRDRTGIVFQDFGLFDEWSARENIAFGADHRRDGKPVGESESVDSLVAELGLERAGRVATLSGGMKQRTALARTLAYDPDIILYDEPTSGLDPAMSAQVARRIRETNDAHGKTSLVVTHDLTALADIADRIILLDADARTFREIARAEVDATLADLAGTRTSDAIPPARGRDVRAMLSGFFAGTTRTIEAAARALVALVPRWPRARWGARYLAYYLRLSAFGSALAYVGLAGFILGLIVTYFTFSFLPFKEYTEPILIDRIIAGIGYALYRILVPGMVAMLVAARSGAAIAADIGHRVYSRQTDALRSLGVPPERYLLTNILWAHLIGMPALLLVNHLCASFGALLVFAAIHPEYSTYFWSSNVDRFLVTDGFFWKGTGPLVAKSLISAFGVGAIAWFLGMRPKPSGRHVSQAVTQAIIASTIFVLLVQLVSALIEFTPL